MKFNRNVKEIGYKDKVILANCIQPLSAAIRAAFSGQTGPY